MMHPIVSRFFPRLDVTEIPRHSTDPPASAKGGANGDRDHVQWCESRVMVCAAVRHVRLFPDQVRLR